MAEIASTDVVPAPAAPQYRSLQALRALAALMVVLHHIGGPDGFEGKIGGSTRVFGWAYLVGPSGVDLFFVISGFIMTVTTAHLVGGVRSARSFLLRRICRIYPAYLVITAAVFLVLLWRPELVNSSQDTRPDVLASFLLLPQEGLPLLLVGWTLVYEMYFYLVFAASLLAPRRLFLPLLLAWGLVVLVLHQLVTPDSSPYLQVAGNLQNLEFLLGTGAALLVTSRRTPPAGLLLVAGVGLLAPSYLAAARSGHLPEDWVRIAGIGLGCALVLAGVVTLELRGRFRTPDALVALGDSSYSLYLVHVPVLKVAALVSAALLPAGLGPHLLAVAAALVLSLLAGEVYHRVVERPLNRLVKRGRLAAAMSDRPPGLPARSSSPLR